MSDALPSGLIARLSRGDLPKRAIVTAGMPYGNKDLHFGHVGGVFVQADAFARYLRDRIGPENVMFVSGTDCYGSPIIEDHRVQVERGTFSGTLEDFVEFNHKRQIETLAQYHVRPNLFAASSIGRYREIHQEMGARFLKTLHANGHLEKRTTPQFFDARIERFLNGRQVQGRCPFQGCRSEKAYADECSLGHQFEPKDLIAPRSTITGEPPEMRDVTNWYLRVPEFGPALKPWLEGLQKNANWRPFVISTLLEHFEPPTIHVTREQADALETVEARLPSHTLREGRGKSVQLVFERLEDMEAAKAILSKSGIRYRAGKTLVPFRLTGNLEWGLPAPEIEGLGGLTFWVWPESLWAPISFVSAYLEQKGDNAEDWRDWWCSTDAAVYQFIGEDNIFFYGLAEMAMFLGMNGSEPTADVPDGQLQMPHIIANRHLLFLDKKASSSGKVKPPMARELLDFYTAGQLRAHFFSLGLGLRSTSFRPKPLDPNSPSRQGDPVLKEGNLLSNAFNRAVRSCFYTAQKFFDGRLPVGEVSTEVVTSCEEAVVAFDEAMRAHEFHRAISAAASLIQEINRSWSQSKPYSDDCAPEVRTQALIDAFHRVRVAAVLMHPIAPEGTNIIREYLNVGEDFWDWNRISEPVYAFMANPAEHAMKFLEPRVDFFEKHPSQVQTRD